MHKNLLKSTEAMNSRQTFLLAIRGQKRELIQEPPYPSMVRDVIETTRLLTQAKILKDEQIPTYTRFDQKEIAQSVFFKLEPGVRENLFVIQTSPLGHRLLNSLRQDLRSIKNHFSQHIFNPYFLAFIRTKKTIEIGYGSVNLFWDLPTNLRTSQPIAAAKNAIDLYYEFVDHIQHANPPVDLTTAVNDFDKRVRQNASSLKEYLQKLLKQHKGLTIIKVNLTSSLLDDGHFESFQRRTGGKAEETTSSYRYLATARTEYLKSIKQRPIVGEMLVGYIWKLGYNPHTAWTYEMVLLFNTEKSLAYTVSEIQEFCEIFGARRGIDSYIIVPPAKRTGHREEKVAMFNSLDIKDKARSHKIQSLITDLIRTDYLVQVVAPDNGRTFGKGGITKKKSRVKTKR